MARVPLPDASRIVADAPHLFETLEISDLHAARAMGNAPHALAGLLDYMDGLYGSLPAEARELAILTTARVFDSRYEWQQHVPVARDIGIENETIRTIGRCQWDQLNGPTAAVVNFVRTQCGRTVTDSQYDALAEHYAAGEIVALSMLVGHYTGVAQVIESMALPLENEFIGWDPESSDPQ